ncbi:GIDE domain-containing protein [Neptunomonas antarctica]|uniref:E3 Ubiquitin ligase n=1 Tax=Neptunomonas antarctica TaxID=619304 RepID=A0A1N7NM09_9GAMM|nr:GIDE domain-containing protein [Neptunomonas antarctica]SIS99406.1 E3 Ubiquitin ligase [Neptunomonas antarctica]
MITQASIGLFITLIAAGATLWKGFTFLKRYRLITGTPTSRIRSAHQGYVEVIGHIIAGEYGPLIAPLSGRECVWYRYSVSCLTSGGKTKHWNVERSGESDAWFQINDATATALVDPAGATVRTENTRVWYGDTANPSISHLTNQQFQHSSNKSSGFSLNTLLLKDLDTSRYRYKETLLFTHEKVYALGQFQSVGGGRQLPSAQQISGDIIREWKQSYDTLVQRFDTNNDQKLDMQEWDDVQTAAHQEAEKRRREISATPTMHVLSCPTETHHPYLISTLDEEVLAKHYGWYALGALVALIGEGYLILHLLAA